MKNFEEFNDELSESFDNNAANDLINQLNHQFTYYSWGTDKGPRYIKVWKTIGSDEMSKSVAFFIDKQTGVVYKAAGWKKRSNTVFGNLTDVDSLIKVLKIKTHMG